jgi:hypothetical protein
MDERSDCAEVRELLPELAAGIAAGDDRARALRHLSGCADCRHELEAMSMVVDELLTLAPAAQPPTGFGSAVLAAVAPPRRRCWRHRALRLAVAVVLAAAAGSAVTIQATADDRRVAAAYRETLKITGGRFLTARPFTAPDGARGGRVFAYQGTPNSPSWVFVLIQYGLAAGRYEVHLVTRDGRETLIGEMDVAKGEGSWGVTIDAAIAQIAEVRVSGVAGPPLTAAFR